jgi:hypothetical protein
LKRVIIQRQMNDIILLDGGTQYHTPMHGNEGKDGKKKGPKWSPLVYRKIRTRIRSSLLSSHGQGRRPGKRSDLSDEATYCEHEQIRDLGETVLWSSNNMVKRRGRSAVIRIHGAD